jgi:hypothetical protein
LVLSVETYVSEKTRRRRVMELVQDGQMLKLRKHQNDFEKQQKAAFSIIKSSKKEADIFY